MPAPSAPTPTGCDTTVSRPSRTQIAAHRRRLDGIAGGLVDALAAGGEFAAAIQRQVADTEALIARLTHERDALDRLTTDGLTEDEAARRRRLCRVLRTGLAHAQPADRRALYELLHLRGTLSLDPEGVPLGRNMFSHGLAGRDSTTQ